MRALQPAPLRILALLTDGFGSTGGIGRYNRDLLGALAASACTDRVVALPRIGVVLGSDVPPKITQRAAQRDRVRYSLQATHMGVTGGPWSLIFCGHLFMAPLAALLSRLLRIPYWLQLHGIEAWQRPSRVTAAAVQSAEVVTAVSRYTRHRFLQWSEIAPDRVRVLANTVEARFQPGPKPLALIERHGLAGRRVALTVSRLAASERYKGHDRVIAAMPAVLRRVPDAVYLIAGDGDDRTRLEGLVASAGLATSVSFAGAVLDRELPDYYRLADTFVMPSTGEGFGIVFLEAAATGLPVIAGNRDGSVDALADGVLGILVDPDNPEALADALVAGLLRGTSRAADLRRFEHPTFNGQVDALLQDILAGSPSRLAMV